MKVTKTANWILRTWCKLTHGRPMHPVSGKYICRRCLRTWPVAWERKPERRAAKVGAAVGVEQ